MTKACAFFSIFFLMAIGCATIAETGRANKFDTVLKDFEKAIKTSDFETALGYMDTEMIKGNTNPGRFKDVKVAGYQVKKRLLSEDGRNVLETIRIDYYWIDSPILQTLQHDQAWKYKDEAETWFLQTELPDFP